MKNTAKQSAPKNSMTRRNKMTIHYLVVVKPNEYDSDPSYELFATETEAKMYMASLPHFVDGELHMLKEGENT